MRIYFKNLDGIRFIAALMVILQHTSDYKAYQQSGLPNMFRNNFMGLGGQGVTLFFVLSGFLIFYLLFAEREKTNTISVRNFYIRRILRIWPLYFAFGLLMVLGIDFFLSRIGEVVHTPVGENLFYLFTFSVNLQMLFAIPNKGIIELYWSVCIEEQFYLIAPLFVKKMKRWLLPAILLFILIGIGSRIAFYCLGDPAVVQSDRSPLYLFTLCRFDNFGFGALAAYILFKKELYARVRFLIENYVFQLALIVFITVYVLNGFKEIHWLAGSTLPPVFYAVLILCAACGRFVFNLEWTILKRLGVYSYGIYVYHAVIAQVLIALFMKFLPEKSILNYEILYPLSAVLVTALVAGLSYEIFEKRFLKLKQRYTIVKNHEV